MKTLHKTLLALVAGTVVTAGANAGMYQNNTGMTGQPYVGVKAGQFNVDADGVDTDNPTAYGIYGGYNFNPNFGIEAEYVRSDKADYTDKTDGVKGTYKAETYGGYGTYRYAFPNTNVYAKGKLGVAKNTLKVDDDKESKTGVAGGIGLGYNLMPNMSVEAEYNRLPSIEDVDSNLWTIGAHMKF